MIIRGDPYGRPHARRCDCHSNEFDSVDEYDAYSGIPVQVMTILKTGCHWILLKSLEA